MLICHGDHSAVRGIAHESVAEILPVNGRNRATITVT